MIEIYLIYKSLGKNKDIEDFVPLLKYLSSLANQTFFMQFEIRQIEILLSDEIQCILYKANIFASESMAKNSFIGIELGHEM